MSEDVFGIEFIKKLFQFANVLQMACIKLHLLLVCCANGIVNAARIAHLRRLLL